jgi:alpha-D-xyloside xylohydrolase
MKFTDGYWQMRPGVTPYYAVHVHDVETTPGSLTVYAPTRRVNHRGGTSDQPLLTMRLSSPMENVVRAQLYHHRGGWPREPYFELQAQPAPEVKVTDDAQAATLTSGRLTVRVEKAGDWRIDFMDGERAITHSGWRAAGFVDAPEGRFIHDQLALGVGECVYGLGERFTAFVKNGQVVDLWNEDGGTASEQAYKNVPFYITSRGYGVFVNHPERVSFEVASERVERVQFSVPGEYLEYFLIYGPSPREVLTRYTALTGRPALPPAWSFGLWLSTSFTTDYDEETVTGFIQGMAERNLPLHVFHFDCFWMKAFHWCDFEWDDRVFPDPEGMLRRLKERGLHICVWINPYIAQRSALFDEGVAHGYLLKRRDSGGQKGAVWQWDKWQAGMGIVDFTDPEARRWYGDKLRALIDMGVDCFKTDFGERIPTDMAYFDGSDPVRMHNYYSYLYNKTVFEVLEEKLGRGRAVVFARSATTGGQQFPVHWGGDNSATFESMAESLRGGLSLALSGFGFWSHDIGGFEQTASADVYKRWCAFGLLSSHSRLHGSSSYRVPWLFDEEGVPGPTASDVLRFFTQLKCRLMPYLFAAAIEAHEMGLPVMRAMMLEFPGDPACDTLDRQYMLGGSLLVAPAFAPEGTVDYYLPEGRWTHFLGGEVVEGGRWVRERHGYLSLPLMARPGSVIPVGADERRPDYDYADGVVFHVFELQDGALASARVPTMEGDTAMTIEVSRAGQQIHVQARGASRPWSVLLRGVPAVRSVEGGTAQEDALGTRVVPEGVEALTIRL